MRSVRRIAKPKSLQKNYKQWTRSLLEQIREKGGYAKVENRYKDKYRQPDVKQGLKEMYENRCCYCEGILGEQTYERIEHLKPKSLYPGLSFVWGNLHLCCEICNTNKNNKWDNKNSILNPTVNKIKNYLSFNTTTGEYEAIENNERAFKTINYVGLNRDPLKAARKKIVIRMIEDYKFYKDKGWENDFYSKYDSELKEVGYRTVYETVLSYLRQKYSQ